MAYHYKNKHQLREHFPRVVAYVSKSCIKITVRFLILEILNRYCFVIAHTWDYWCFFIYTVIWEISYPSACCNVIKSSRETHKLYRDYHLDYLTHCRPKSGNWNSDTILYNPYHHHFNDIFPTHTCLWFSFGIQSLFNQNVSFIANNQIFPFWRWILLDTSRTFKN